MNNRRTFNYLFSLFLATVLFFQPLLQIVQLTQLTGGWLPRVASIAHAQAPAQDDTNTYLPAISNGSLQTTPTATPEPGATATATPTATNSPMPTATPTATATGTSPTPTATTPAATGPAFEICLRCRG